MGLVKTRRLAAMQKQQRAKAGIGSVANVGVLPVPMLPISNWGLKLVRVGLVCGCRNEWVYGTLVPQ